MFLATATATRRDNVKKINHVARFQGRMRTKRRNLTPNPDEAKQSVSLEDSSHPSSPLTEKTASACAGEIDVAQSAELLEASADKQDSSNHYIYGTYTIIMSHV